MTTDKSLLLPDGPWQTEPDHVDFIHYGFPCIAHRGPVGAWCGYVGVPEGHPWFGRHYDDVDADVHGGLTYAEPCRGDVCHAGSEKRWWLGFDCSHCRDMMPLAILKSTHGGTYRSIAYVLEQTRELAALAYRADPSHQLLGGVQAPAREAAEAVQPSTQVE